MTTRTKRIAVAVVLAVALSAGVAVAQFIGSSGEATVTVAPGTHTFQVRACDSNNNCDETPATYTWEVVAANSAPLADATWHADTATVSVEAGGDIKEVLFYVNGVMAARKTAPPYERRTKKTGDLTLKQSVRENDGDSAVTTLSVTN